MPSPTHPFRRVAILTHYFEPLQSIQVNRLEAFCRFFRAQGLEVLVLTRYWDGNETSGTEVFASHNIPPTATTRPDGVQVVRYPSNAANPMRRKPGGWWFWGKSKGYWLQAMRGRIEHTHDFTYGNEEDLLVRLRDFKPDFLMTSIPMNYLGPATATLAQQLGVPFWVDIRDLHNNELAKPGYRAPIRRRWMDRLMERRLRWVCQGATLVTTISQPFEGLTQQLYGARQTATLTNGYEEALFADLRTRPIDSSCFHIVYNGTLYDQQFDKNWLIAFSQFLISVPAGKAKLTFIGTKVSDKIRKEIEAFLPATHYAIEPRQPRREVLERIAAAAVLFYPGWRDHNGILSGKLFEYIGLERAIAIFNPNPELRKIIAYTKCGLCFDTTEEMERQLAMWYQQHQKTGSLEIEPDRKAISSFSREAQIHSAWLKFLSFTNTF